MHTPRSLGPLAQSFTAPWTWVLWAVGCGQMNRDSWDLRRKERWADLPEQCENRESNRSILLVLSVMDQPAMSSLFRRFPLNRLIDRWSPDILPVFPLPCLSSRLVAW
jgi:hypothetical protein